jgi:glucose/arabinose dehydrogenase
MNGAASMTLATDATAARQGGRRLPSAIGAWQSAIPLVALLGLASLTGCGPGPRALSYLEQKVIDRSLVEYPSGYELRRVATGLTAPTAVAVDPAGNLLVAEGGVGGNDVRIWAFTPQGERYPIYPMKADALPTFGLGGGEFEIHGPVGSMRAYDGRIYVAHHDDDGMGVITALDYWGGHRTVVSGVPARGEHGMGGMAVDRKNKRLFFGVGSVTNSGVVGADTLQFGFV